MRKLWWHVRRVIVEWGIFRGDGGGYSGLQFLQVYDLFPLHGGLVSILGQDLPDNLRNVFAENIKLDVNNGADFYLMEVCDLPGEWNDGHLK